MYQTSQLDTGAHWQLPPAIGHLRPVRNKIFIIIKSKGLSSMKMKSSSPNFRFFRSRGRGQGGGAIFRPKPFPSSTNILFLLAVTISQRATTSETKAFYANFFFFFCLSSSNSRNQPSMYLCPTGKDLAFSYHSEKGQQWVCARYGQQQSLAKTGGKEREV